jgi:hypothetical protein
MRHLARLALVACLALTASAVDAAPRHGHHTKAKKKKKASKKKHVTKARHAHVESDDEDEDVRVAAKSDDDDVRVTDEDQDADEDQDEDRRDDKDSDDDDERKPHELASLEAEDDAETEDVYEERDDVEPVKLHNAAAKKPWSFALGPYVWASSVDANVSLGGASVAAGVDFIDITRHTKFGMELLGEARYRKLCVTGDMTYGLVALNGSREVGPFMVTVDGRAGSLMADGTAGYQIGGDDSKLAIEPRVGLRYQRTAVAMKVGLNENMLTPPAIVTSSRDALAGARVFVRPSRRVYFTGTGDIGMFGDSRLTWSAAVDASVHVSKYVLVSVGYRSLTTESPNISLVMHGPRFAVQATF